MGIDFRRPRRIRGFGLGEVLIFGPGIGRVLVEKTASGAIAHITDGADGVPLKNWLVTLPASFDGYSAIGCNEGGANFIELYTRASHNGIDYSINADGSLHRYGTASGNSFNNPNATNYSNCPYKFRAGTYTLSVSGSGDNTSFTSLGIYLASGASFTSQGITGNGTKTFTVSEDFGAWYYIKTNSGVTVNDDVYIWISAGSTADAYEPYTAPTTYTASLGRTIYGGTADIVTGEGVEQYGYIVFDGSSDENWGGYSAYNGYYIDISDMKSGTRQDGVCNQLTCSKSTTQGQTNAFWLGAGNKRLYVIGVYDSMGSTLEAFKAYIAENPLILVYPLATPETFTFTPITPTPETPLGVSNFWADEGDSDVTYYADQSLIPDTPTRSLQLSPSPEVDEEVVDEEVEEGVDDMR